MMTDTRLMGIENGPVSPLNYKRAVVKSAPHEFTVEVLCPTKQGSHFSYGIKVCPVVRSRGSSDSRSTSSYSEYEIWRRWEDCLDFQETLENEYSKMSRQKVKVLKRAAAGKKRSDESESPYSLRNAAASFESLPEGPDPREVAMDVHKMIPALTRKGSLFRVSRSTVKQRGDEFAAMIQALFNGSEDAPVLLQALRNCSTVRDFFAVWRRDKELLKKTGKDVSRLHHSNHSMSSLSNFSFTTSSTTPSSPASSAFPSMASPAAFLRHSMFSRTMTDCHGEAMPSSPVSAPPSSRQFVPDASTSPSYSSPSHEHRLMAPTDTSSGSIIFTDELLLQDEPVMAVQSAPPHRTFSHGPETQPSCHFALPENQSQTSYPSSTRVPHPISENELNQLPRPQPRLRSKSAATPGYRNARIFVSAPSSALGIVESSPRQSDVSDLPITRTSPPPPTQPTRHVAYTAPISQSSSHTRSLSSAPSMSMNRFSVVSSISSYTQASKRSSSYGSELSYDSDACVDQDMTFPNSPVVPHTPLSEIAEAQDFESGHQSRDSASSFTSLRTEASADGVLPRHLHPHVSSPRDKRVGGSTLPLDGHTQSLIEPISEGGEDLLGTSFTDLAEGNGFSMETLDKELPRFFGHRNHSIGSVSSVGSVVSASDLQVLSSPRDDAFVVKAVYNECVIVFRAERNMSLMTIRQRIKERFALHECVPLDERFVLGYIPSKTNINGVGRRGRSNSVNSTASDLSHLRFLRTEVDWQGAMVTSNGKLTLRVLDPEPHL